MDMLKSMLDKLYSSQNGMMYFYIISALIAFILIILIIVTIVKGNKVEEIKDDNKEENLNLDELKSEELNKESINSAPTLEAKVDDINLELNMDNDNTILADSTMQETEDDLVLPKVKEVLDENEEVGIELSNDVFAERLNALKNKN